jgi:hypothetical protein
LAHDLSVIGSWTILGQGSDGEPSVPHSKMVFSDVVLFGILGEDL